MQSAFKIVEKWCQQSGLTVNADKTVIVPFTSRYKLDNLTAPKLFGKTTSFSKEVKYLGVILDQRLNWNQHLAHVIRKAKIALGTCCRLTNSRWGLKPNYMRHLYTTVVRPIITYGCASWHKKTHQVTSIKQLTSLQGLACRIITGALPSTPITAMEAILNLEPLHILVQREARTAILRSAEGGKTSWKSGAMTRLYNNLIACDRTMAMPSDATTKEFNFDKLFKIILPQREEWENAVPESFKQGNVIWFTDGSKKEGSTGAGVYGLTTKTRKYSNLGSHASVFQAEMYAIIDCATENLNMNLTDKHITIFSDSRAALLALKSVETKSKLTMDGIKTLNKLGLRNKVTLAWVPGHKGIKGNEIADELAKKGSETTTFGPEPIVGVSKTTTRSALKTWATTSSKNYWHNLPGQRQAKSLVHGFSPTYSLKVLNLNRSNLRIFIRVITGHCRLNKHLSTIGVTNNPACRFCNEEEETSMHVLCDCVALSRLRSRLIGGCLVSPCDIKDLDPMSITRFFTTVGLGDQI